MIYVIDVNIDDLSSKDTRIAQLLQKQTI